MKAILLLFAMAISFANPVSATELSDKLRTPDHVLLMRHAEAPGIGDPPQYSLADCKSQRNLDSRGRAQARATGAWLKRQGVTSAQLFSSPWCRCKDTATLLELGQVTVEPSLGSFFGEPQQADASTAGLQAFITQALPSKGERALILVTHNVNIRAYVGENTGSGDMVLARVNSQGKVLSFERYPSPK
jgi:phosphohistidine phosphatase SixA